MTRTDPHPLAPSFAFLVGATAIYACGAAIVRALPGLEHPHVVAAGVAFDLTLTVTFLAWLLPVRKGVWPPGSLFAVLLLSVAAARHVLPADDRTLSGGLVLLGAVAEAALLGWLGARTIRAVKRAREQGDELDLLAHLQVAARDILWNRRVADLVAFELAALVYALGPRRAAHRPAGRLAFNYHRRTAYGAVVGALAMVVAAETVPLHLLLSRWRPGVAWAVTALGLYTMVYLLAD